jgi:pilus assembly protein CpaF
MLDLRALVYEHDEIADLDPAARRLALREILADAGAEDVAAGVAYLADEIDGSGPLSGLMSDDSITDILVNGPDEVCIERDGELIATGCTFDSVEHLTQWCERQIAGAGGRVDASSPIADARLPDGSRIHVVLPPVAPGGPLVSIRRFGASPLSLDDLVALDSMSGAQAEVLRASIRDGHSFVVSGATGTGKTTLLNALLGEVSPLERVVVIEELPELCVTGSNRVSLIGRSANAEGRGNVSLAELVRASLRMRPDRIVVGEVRGPEALPALWAMRTGHSGTMLSIHAANAADASRRLVQLALMSEHSPSEETLRHEVDACVDIRVHLGRCGRDRVVEEITVTR